MLWGFWGSDRYPEFEWSVLFCSLAYLHNMRDLERGLTSTKMAWHGLAKYSLKMSYIWVEVQYTINQLSHDISPLWRRILWRVIWMRQLFQFKGKLPIWCFLSKIVASYLITILYSNQRNMPYDQDLRISRGANIQLESGIRMMSSLECFLADGLHPRHSYLSRQRAIISWWKKLKTSLCPQFRLHH